MGCGAGRPRALEGQETICPTGGKPSATRRKKRERRGLAAALEVLGAQRWVQSRGRCSRVAPGGEGPGYWEGRKSRGLAGGEVTACASRAPSLLDLALLPPGEQHPCFLNCQKGPSGLPERQALASSIFIQPKEVGALVTPVSKIRI